MFHQTFLDPGGSILKTCVPDWVKMDFITLSKTGGLPVAPIADESDRTQPASVHYANGSRAHE